MISVKTLSVTTSTRTAFLIRCSQPEANRIRAAARSQDRTISGYVLHSIRATWPAQDQLRKVRKVLDPRPRPQHAYEVRSTPVPSTPNEPRAAMLVRCSLQDAARIRA